MMPSIESAAAQMRWLCDEGNVGYDQWQRWTMDPDNGGGETDCSAMVISVLRWAGFDTGSATYTGNMSGELCSHGWVRLPADISACRVGDILLNETHHVCMVVAGSGWGATIAQASIDENGGAHGGQAGDQTGWETNTRAVYDFPWDCILRWVGDNDAPAPEDGTICGVDAAMYRQWARELQGALNGRLGDFGLGGVSVDGVPGVETQRGVARLMQASDNVDYNAGLDVDGIIGPATLAAIAAHPVGEGCETHGNDVWCVKAGLVIQGWDVDLTTWEWDATCTKVLAGHQSWHGLDQDGVCGAATLPTLLPLACA